MSDKPRQGNQYVADPRQLVFLANWQNPKSKTFGNIYQSALNAGYSESYSNNMRAKSLEWVSENVGMITKDKLVTKAKNNLDKLLDSADEKIQADITKFVAKTDKEFSDKVDITSDGKAFEPITVRIINEARDSDTSRV